MQRRNQLIEAVRKENVKTPPNDEWTELCAVEGPDDELRMQFVGFHYLLKFMY